MRAEPEAARLLRAGDAFELLRAEPALELLRAAALEPLRAAEFELLRAALELELRRLGVAAVAPLSLADGRLRFAPFGDALCFVFACLATWRSLYGSSKEDHGLQHRLRRGACSPSSAALRSACERRPPPLELGVHFGAQRNHDVRDPQLDQ